MVQTDFANMRIGSKPDGYYSECLEACLAEVEHGQMRLPSTYISEVSDIVLARAQLYLCNIKSIDTHEFLRAFDILASARFRVNGISELS